MSRWPLKWWWRRPKAAVPGGKRVYAIGDIHGRLDLLDQILGIIEKDIASAQESSSAMIFLGDYVDRGSDSRGVIDKLCEVRSRDTSAIFLRGNHEQALMNFLKDPVFYLKWREFGGDETLLSYGVELPLFDDEEELLRARRSFAEMLSPQHLEFLEQTAHCHIEGDYVFVHAGIRPGVAIADQSKNDMLWIRDEFLSSTALFEKTVVHGHSARKTPEIYPNRICIDTKAYESGRLTVLVLENTKRRFLRT